MCVYVCVCVCVCTKADAFWKTTEAHALGTPGLGKAGEGVGAGGARIACGVGHLRHLIRVFGSSPRPKAADAHPELIVPNAKGAGYAGARARKQSIGSEASDDVGVRGEGGGEEEGAGASGAADEDFVLHGRLQMRLLRRRVLCLHAKWYMDRSIDGWMDRQIDG